MLPSERRVVISGIGLASPIGIGPEAYWSSLSGSRGGIAAIRAFTVEGLPSAVAAEIGEFDASAYAFPRNRKALKKSAKYMARDIELAVGAALMAIRDAGLENGGVEPTRIGIDLGAGLIASELDELTPAIERATAPDGRFDYHVWGKEAMSEMEPIWLLKYLPNMLACHISILLDCQGPSNTITEAEAAALVAIGEATRIIARGRADVMITGGADSKIHPLSLVRMSLLGQLTHWQGEPAKACKPFDVHRDGGAPGEGAGILILEEREHALKRNARIYGEVLGFGSGCDAAPQEGIDPDGVGTEIAMRAALRDAGLEPKDIGHFNAHGSGVRAMDLAEARASHRVFGGPRSMPITSIKGFIGNCYSGAGSMELIASLLGVNRGLIPPTLNCDEPDPECAADVVRGGPRETTNPIFIKTNLTRFGQAAALVVKGGLETEAAGSSR